jgi:hypothetical protein
MRPYGSPCPLRGNASIPGAEKSRLYHGWQWGGPGTMKHQPLTTSTDRPTCLSWILTGSDPSLEKSRLLLNQPVPSLSIPEFFIIIFCYFKAPAIFVFGWNLTARENVWFPWFFSSIFSFVTCPVAPSDLIFYQISRFCFKRKWFVFYSGKNFKNGRIGPEYAHYYPHLCSLPPAD